MGDHLTYLSENDKTGTFIGIEPFINGVANLLTNCLERKISNLYIYPSIWQNFINDFPKFTFNEIYILFSDPWPKKKHAKRRLVTQVFLQNILLHARKNFKIYFATDNVDYFDGVIEGIKSLQKNHKINFRIIENFKYIKTKYQVRADKLGLKSKYLVIENH